MPLVALTRSSPSLRTDNAPLYYLLVLGFLSSFYVLWFCVIISSPLCRHWPCFPLLSSLSLRLCPPRRHSSFSVSIAIQINLIHPLHTDQIHLRCCFLFLLSNIRIMMRWSSCNNHLHVLPFVLDVLVVSCPCTTCTHHFPS